MNRWANCTLATSLALALWAAACCGRCSSWCATRPSPSASHSQHQYSDTRSSPSSYRLLSLLFYLLSLWLFFSFSFSFLFFSFLFLFHYITLHFFCLTGFIWQVDDHCWCVLRFVVNKVSITNACTGMGFWFWFWFLHIFHFNSLFKHKNRNI